ncbi:MAG: PIN domain-containing protein [Spirochaetales bacterium]|nr:PIN domain-containing protein [Spirochaetales bacterium]
MKIVDANVVLRYLLADVPTLFTRSEQILENEAVYLPFEVLAEVVYVLDKVYAVSRGEISASLTELLKYPTVSTYNAEVAIRALETYSDSSLDIVDALLCGYRSVQGVEVVSFDKQLNKRLRTS